MSFFGTNYFMQYGIEQQLAINEYVIANKQIYKTYNEYVVDVIEN